MGKIESEKACTGVGIKRRKKKGKGKYRDDNQKGPVLVNLRDFQSIGVERFGPKDSQEAGKRRNQEFVRVGETDRSAEVSILGLRRNILTGNPLHKKRLLKMGKVIGSYRGWEKTPSNINTPHRATSNHLLREARLRGHLGSRIPLLIPKYNAIPACERRRRKGSITRLTVVIRKVRHRRDCLNTTRHQQREPAPLCHCTLPRQTLAKGVPSPEAAATRNLRLTTKRGAVEGQAANDRPFACEKPRGKG